MLRIITGRAGTGKSRLVMSEIAQSVAAEEKGSILVVPEQYSHEAERELCAFCGDRLSLYAEVLTFTGLCRSAASQLGGSAVRYLDNGGRLLCMALAADGLYSRLRVYSAARRDAGVQLMLLSAVDELKSACITPEQLLRAASDCDTVLADKLHDLALILEAFDAVVANGHADPADSFSVLADSIERSGIFSDRRIYFDGFTDFSAQERRVIEALLKKGAAVTLCLGCDALEGGSEIFEPSRMTARRFISFAEENGIVIKLETCDKSTRSEAMSFFSERMFTYSQETFCGDASGIRVAMLPDVETECEFAAAEAIRLIRETGCRRRDIAVAVRGFEDYRLPLEAAFAHYGVPLYTARKADLGSKPLPALIAAAYEIICGGWELDDVTDYLRTGLTGLSLDECDELESYAFLWQLRGNAWTKDDDWQLHPDGNVKRYDDTDRERLSRINGIRRRVTGPLMHFAENAGNAVTASMQAAALAGLLEELGTPSALEEKSERLSESGRGVTAQEYAQLWELTVSALEQCAAILGETESDAESFGRLFMLMLSSYDIGTIPAALDCVTAGDFDRMRRRNIRHLIVLGASDTRLPRENTDTGTFSDDERKRLLELSVDLGGLGDCELWREFSLIYNCLTLPSETLTLCYPAFDAKGEPQREAFVARRALALTGGRVLSPDTAELRTNAAAPALTLAAGSLRGGGSIEASAAELWKQTDPERMEALLTASELKRGRLSKSSADALYGEKLRLSATKIDKLASCRFAYFLQYGLKAKPRKAAELSPPEIGIFMHDILEKVAREVKESGGFGEITGERLDELTEKYAESFIRERLNDFREKSKRFEHIFRRLIREVKQIVRDMASELKCSDFEPLSFELDFDKEDKIPPILIGEAGSLKLTGVADRVDGWVHDGKLYLRVMDYKTGVRKFSLSDVWYGMGLQMLLYLFALEKSGRELYGMEAVPAGVLYITAKDKMIRADCDLSDEEIAKAKGREQIRSGLVLDDPEVVEAMEHGDEKKYIPVKIKGGVPSGDALASAERFGLLAAHIEKTLTELASELKDGSITADPYFRSQQENACIYCDYRDICHFVNGKNGDRMRNITMPASKVWSVLEGGEQDA